MKISTVKFKEVKSAGIRLDAPVHLSDGILAKRLIRNSPYHLLKIGDVAERVWHAGRWRRVYVTNPEHGITLLGSSAILKSDLSNEKMISLKYTDDIEDKKLQKGWTLISCSGTIGNCAFANAQHAEKLASQDVIRLKPNNILREGLVYAYLASKYGYSMLTQGTFGSVIQHIEPQNVEAIPIPEFPDTFQQEVDDLIQESARLREEAADALEEAVRYFDEKYSIKDGLTKCFSLKLSQLKLGIAAYNNNLEVDEFIDKYKKDSIRLKDITSKIFAPPMFKHIYLDKNNGFPFMTGSELTQFNLRYYRWLSPRGVKDIKDYIVNKGTLLLYKSGTTDGGILGNVFIADKKLDGCCLSDHVIRIVFNDEDMAYWAFAFLKSKGAVKMLQRLATGTMIPFITPERISEIQIPIPDNNYDKIVKLVDNYIELNSQSKENETRAIRMVEQEIEKWDKH